MWSRVTLFPTCVRHFEDPVSQVEIVVGVEAGVGEVQVAVVVVKWLAAGSRKKKKRNRREQKSAHLPLLTDRARMNELSNKIQTISSLDSFEL